MAQDQNATTPAGEQAAENEIDILVMADKFINAANELVQNDKQDVGRVGGAMLYAVSRFNAYEASVKTNDLAASKDEAVEWFTGQFKEMLTDNIDQYIAMIKQQSENK